MFFASEEIIPELNQGSYEKYFLPGSLLCSSDTCLLL